jgi:hypothetical protein
VVAGGVKDGNTRHLLQEDKTESPVKVHLPKKLSRFGRTQVVASLVEPPSGLVGDST